jgi:hypothetical protein
VPSVAGRIGLGARSRLDQGVLRLYVPAACQSHSWRRPRTGASPTAGFVEGIWAAASLVHLSTSENVEVLGQFAQLLRPGGRLHASVSGTGDTGWLDEPDGRRWYTVWQSERFAEAVAAAGFQLDAVRTDIFVEVRGTRGR